MKKPNAKRKMVIEFLDTRPDCMSRSALIESVAVRFAITKANARYYVTRVWNIKPVPNGADIKLPPVMVDKKVSKKGPPQLDAMLNQIMGNAGYGREGKI